MDKRFSPTVYRS